MASAGPGRAPERKKNREFSAQTCDCPESYQRKGLWTCELTLIVMETAEHHLRTTTLPGISVLLKVGSRPEMTGLLFGVLIQIQQIQENLRIAFGVTPGDALLHPLRQLGQGR